MDFLKAEVERKKKQLEKDNLLKGDKKYFKRSELSSKREEEYYAKRARLNNREQSPATSAQAETAAEKRSKAKAKADEDEQDTATSKPVLSRKEVIRRLRERNEPITLFGEIEHESYLRLKKMELLEPEVNKGYKNDFKAAMDKVDQQYLNEMSMGSHSAAKNAYNVHFRDSGMVEEDMPRMATELGESSTDKDQDHIMMFFKYVLQKWGESLNVREEDEKKSRQGKIDTATHSQTVSYLKPLMRDFKNRSCSPEILARLVEVCKHLLVRDYIAANEAYMEMAIGNSPWPIGVTMVGIHARKGREKINDKNVAHVLNDETQRKYIQAVKRLMTRAQKYFPGRLARMVNYEKPTTSV